MRIGKVNGIKNKKCIHWIWKGEQNYHLLKIIYYKIHYKMVDKLCYLEKWMIINLVLIFIIH
jgi:hypothetical protein